MRKKGVLPPLMGCGPAGENPVGSPCPLPFYHRKRSSGLLTSMSTGHPMYEPILDSSDRLILSFPHILQVSSAPAIPWAWNAFPFLFLLALCSLPLCRVGCC